MRALGARVVSPSVTLEEWEIHSKSEYDAACWAADAAEDALGAAKAENKPTLVYTAKVLAARRIREAAKDRHALAIAVANIAEGSKSGQIFIDLPDKDITITCVW